MSTSLVGWLLLAIGVVNLTASVIFFARSVYAQQPWLWALMLACYVAGAVSLLQPWR